MHSISVSPANQSNLPNPNTIQLLSCSWCIKSFRRKDVLKNHLKVHTGEKPFLCEVHGCNKRYSRAGRLKIHMRLHVSFLFKILCFRLAKDLSSALKTDAKKLSEKKEIY